MKRYPLLLVLLFALRASAQTIGKADSNASENQTSGKSAAIDLKALNLLARVADKYNRATLYRGVTEIRFGEEGQKMKFTRFRIELWRFRFGTVVRADRNGVTRFVTDGHRVLTTRSGYPRQYMLEDMPPGDFGFSGGHLRDVFLARAGFRGGLTDLMSRGVGHMLLEPHLTSLSLDAPVKENGITLQPITIIVTGIDKKVAEERRTFFIADDLTLRRMTARDVFTDQPTAIWTESHSEIEILRGLSEHLKDQFSTLPPKDYKQVNYWAARQ
jgi:hypothetical protein